MILLRINYLSHNESPHEAFKSPHPLPLELKLTYHLKIQNKNKSSHSRMPIPLGYDLKREQNRTNICYFFFFFGGTIAPIICLILIGVIPHL